jgi:hypothetical protein
VLYVVSGLSVSGSEDHPTFRVAVETGFAVFALLVGLAEPAVVGLAVGACGLFPPQALRTKTEINRHRIALCRVFIAGFLSPNLRA